MAYWCHMVTKIWVNIGWGNGLLLCGTKPKHKPCWLVTVRSSDIHLRVISLEIPQPSIKKMSLKYHLISWDPVSYHSKAQIWSLQHQADMHLSHCVQVMGSSGSGARISLRLGPEQNDRHFTNLSAFSSMKIFLSCDQNFIEMYSWGSSWQ